MSGNNKVKTESGGIWHHPCAIEGGLTMENHLEVATETTYRRLLAA